MAKGQENRPLEMAYSLQIYFLLIFFNAGVGFAAAVARLKGSAFGYTAALIIIVNSIAIGKRDIGSTADTIEYVSMFRGEADYISGIEPAFRLILFLLQSFISDPNIFLFALAVLINTSIIVSFHKIIKERSLIAYAFFSSGYVYWIIHFQTIRNGLAAAFIILALAYSLQGRNFRTMCTAALAVGTHFSSILPLTGFVFLQSLLGRSVKYIAYAVLAALVGAVIFWYIIEGTGILDPWFARIEAYEYYAATRFRESRFGVQHVFAILLVIYFTVYWKVQAVSGKKIFLAYLSSIICSLILWENILYRDRMFLFGQLLEPILIWIAISQRFSSAISLAIFVALTCLSGYLTVFVWGPGAVLGVR